ncbi:MAG: lysophospholipid acyltransferase family protein [Catalinimonas sp.]
MRKLYRAWCLTWFGGTYLALFPLFWLCLLRPAWYRHTGTLNRIWARVFYFGSGLPIRVDHRFKPGRGPYVYCANHTSYLDIPTTGYALPGYLTYVGKASLTKVPLFGWMFKKLHIAVDRRSRISGYRSLVASYAAIDRGSSLIIFPEGGICDLPQPRLMPFKDGPFRIAIEKQVPVVPVTIPHNWRVLPDNGTFLPYRHPSLVVVHAPIETRGLTMDDLPALRRRTYDVIWEEWRRHHPQLVKHPQHESIA